MNLSSTSAALASPLQRLLTTISSQATAGSISTADATALSEAATDIDSTLSAGRSASANRAERLSPEDMKSRVDSLVDGEVEKGTLTSEQASTLKTLLAQNAPQGESGRAGGAGGPGGPPPGPPPSGTSGGSSQAEATTSTSSDVGDLLQSFIEQLRGIASEAGGYTTGSATSGSRFSALLIDFQA